MASQQMTSCDGRHLFKRSELNPLLTADDWPYPVNSVFNAGAVRLHDGKTLLLARAEDMRGISHLSAARSGNGVTNWQIDPEPTFLPDPVNWPEEIWGIEDPRITWIPEREEYAIVYTSYSRGGPGVALAFTEDFRHFDRMGMVLSPDDKDAALFPRRFDDRWAVIHRPVSMDRPWHIWLSMSPDLRHWGEARILVQARRGAWWDARKIGLSTPPLETDQGWLIFYHGVRETAHGSLYRLGAALLDKDEPRRVLLRSGEWMFGPEAPYERVGDVADVVFPCGLTLGEDGETLHLYYGAADTSICLATSTLSQVLDWLQTCGRPGEEEGAP
ncbi:MAG: glycosidase [Planctomycetota bacterium]